MIEIVKELPEHVELSQHLRERADFYLCVQSLGVSYYIPATPDVRRLLSLDKRGRDAKPDGRRRWTIYDKGDALRDIVSALSLQVRDVELAGVEQNVTETLLDRMREVMSPTVRRLVQRNSFPKLRDSETMEDMKQTNERKRNDGREH